MFKVSFDKMEHKKSIVIVIVCSLSTALFNNSCIMNPPIIHNNILKT